MAKYMIRATKDPVTWGAGRDNAVYTDVSVVADTFKVNDQGTIIFSWASGATAAAFKTWTAVARVED